MQEVAPNIFIQPIPLKGSPLKELNCFIIKGDAGNLVVDTGFNQPEAKEALLGALSELGCDLDRTDVFLTHMHVDHSGLVYALKTPRNKAYASENDGNGVNAFFEAKTSADNSMERRGALMGFSEESGNLASSHPASSSRGTSPVDFTFVREGDRIEAGQYSFEVLDLAGHTPGQIGLYERNHRLLFGGDHILGKITPNITSWGKGFDALGTYMKNLEKVRQLPLDRVFSAHRALVDNPAERIDQLLAHHERRLAEVLTLLQKGEQTVYQIASGMHWEFGGGNFLEFPTTQKWFAAGEAMAHLEHLVVRGSVACSHNNDLLLYALN